MNYTKDQIKVLPEYEGIAENMGDFFSPDDCLNDIIVRQGKIKNKGVSSGVSWFLMAATKIGGHLQLVTFTREGKYYGDWQHSTFLVSGNFEDLIKAEFNIKTA